MHDHAALSGQVARLFGNAQFEPPMPLDLVVYVISNHDAGWIDFDRSPDTDPATQLPFTVFGTPAPLILPTSRASPDYNERHHPFCGLLSSMHTWGIYNGRYGFTKAGRLARISDADKPAVERMLSFELERQTRLKAELSRSSETSTWIEQERLFQSYKLLQFCDLMAIYFNTTHAEARQRQEFTNVPVSPHGDTTVTIDPKGDGVYALSPYPLAADGVELAFAYREITPGQGDREGGWGKVLRAAPTRWETFRLVAS